MPTYPESGVKLVADVADFNSAMDEAISKAQEFDSIGSVTLTVEADTSSVEGDLADLPLDGETITQTVDIEKTDTARQSLDALNVLKNAKILETTWNIVGTGVELIQRFGGDLLQPMLNLDTAVAKVNAQTGNAIPNARELIKTIFYDDLGESIDQVGNLITKAQQLKAPVDEATRSALTFTHTFTDQNPEQVLNTLNQLVVNKLSPDFKTAGDILVTAFQNGANRGNDLLQALEKNATAIRNLGLTGPEALSFIKTGLDNGIDSAQTVINLLEKIKQNVTNAAGNPTSDVSKTLKQLGISNPAETGKAWSADFFKAVIDKIANAPGLTDTQKETLFSNLAGGKQGGKTFAAFLQMSPEEADTIFANVKGAADRAAQEADNSISGALADFQLAVSKKVQDVLSSSAIDLPGKIAALKTGLQNALNELAQGGSLSDALTVALKPIGFDDEFQGLESALGNFVIGILQAVAQLQDITGHGAEATGTRNVIVGMAKTQLDFDLKIANPEELQLAISTATSRGLSDPDIAKEISGTVQGLIKEGTKDSLAQAQQIIDTLKTPIDQNKLPTLASGAPMNVEPVVSDEALDNLQGQIDTAMAKVPPPEKVDAWQQSLDAMNISTQNLTSTAQDANQPIDKAAKSTDDLAKSASKVYPSTDKTSDSLETVTVQADTASPALLGVADSLQVVIDKAHAVSSAADAVAQQNAQPDASNTPTSGPHAIGTDSVTGTFTAGEQGTEIITTNQDLAILNHMTTDAIMAALSGYISGGYASRGSGGNSYTAVNNNFVQSDAQADRLGYSTAEQLRGMAGTT